MITKIKGTYDILPKDVSLWQDLENVIIQVSRLYNFDEIRTPIFEQSELFHRSVGESSDIVKKETYDFKDRGDRMITLRPEGTASVVRSVIENKLYADANLPLKYFYYGPMFRYERPQKGRQRQFHQFGAEAMGSNSPLMDAEVIAYAYTFLKALHIPNVIVKVNSLGNVESKELYKAELLSYLKPNIHSLCEDCNRRYLDNPLRVLDCKVDSNNPILLNAPKPVDSLTEDAKQHFETVVSYLSQMKIPFVIDKNLVRGLDYYTHTVFEFEADLPTLGAQATLGGGGRYNHLFESLDGPAFPAVGFAFGMERLLLALESVQKPVLEKKIHAFMIVLGEKAKEKALAIVTSLRHGGLCIDYDFFERGLKAQFKQAERQNPKCYLIFGDDEATQNVVNVKNAKTGVQETVKLEEVYRYIVTLIQNEEHQCGGSCDSCEEEC